MASSITDDLKRTFGVAALRKVARKILAANEWKELQLIKKTYSDRRQYEQRAHELEYHTRVEVVRKRLINQAGEKNKDFKHRWFSNDRFDKSAITRQAHRQVRNQHFQLLGRLETLEIKDVEALMDRSAHRLRLRENPKQDFSKAVDRRHGERRKSQSIRRGR